jgi:hypothetical protein
MLKIEELENSSFIVVAEGVENLAEAIFFLNFCCCHLGRFFLRQGLSSTWSTLGSNLRSWGRGVAWGRQGLDFGFSSFVVYN